MTTTATSSSPSWIRPRMPGSPTCWRSSPSGPTWPTTRTRPRSSRRCSCTTGPAAASAADDAGARRAGRARPGAARRARDRRARRRVRGPAVVDRATAAFERHDRRAARERRRGRRPLRQAGRQRPHLERAGEARGRATPRRSSTTTPTTSSRSSRRPGSGPATRSPRRSTSSTPAAPAQTVHRDYHLGFQSAESARRYPAHVHALSPVLTLQGAVAHCDMPVESGPTLYLPHSQKYAPGYLAYRRPEFQEYFVAHHVQLPWPRATPCSSTRRCSTPPAPTTRPTSGGWRTCCRSRSAFGRAMETVDRRRMCEAVYPALRPRARRRDAAARVAQRRRRLAPRATPSRPTSTATSPSTGCRRRPRRSSSSRGSTPTSRRRSWTAGSRRS